MGRWRIVLMLALVGCGGGGRVGVTLPWYQIEVVDPACQARLVSGFEDIHGGWRWTAGRFAVTLDVPADRPLYLVLDAGAPQEMFVAQGEVRLTARVNGRMVGGRTWRGPERSLTSLAVPAEALEGQVARIEFELDRTFRDEASGRERGLMALGVGLSNLDSTPEAMERLKEATRAAYEANRRRRQVAISADQDQELMKLFHTTPIWRNFRFHAVQIEKSPLDLWNMQEAIEEIRPEFIVETGTYRGGSALFWANALNGLGLGGSRVLTVDVSNYNTDAAEDRLWGRYVEFIQGSSTDPAVVKRIAERVKGHRTLVTLDSDHTGAHVLRELRMYGPMVSKGSYLVVEDTDMDGVPTYPDSFPGPLAAVTRYLSEGGAAVFEPDAGRERMGITYNPGGWLRRK